MLFFYKILTLLNPLMCRNLTRTRIVKREGFNQIILRRNRITLVKKIFFYNNPHAERGIIEIVKSNVPFFFLLFSPSSSYSYFFFFLSNIFKLIINSVLNEFSIPEFLPEDTFPLKNISWYSWILFVLFLFFYSFFFPVLHLLLPPLLVLLLSLFFSNDINSHSRFKRITLYIKELGFLGKEEWLYRKDEGSDEGPF